MSEKKEIKEQLDEKGFKEEKPNMRQIIIETDGSSIRLVKNECAGALELAAVLQTLLNGLTQQR